VRLSAEERAHLQDMVRRGKEAAYRRRHAEVLLLVDEGAHGPSHTDVETAERTGFRSRTVEQIRERCVTEGLDAAIERKKRSRDRSRRLDGGGEAQLVTLACSEAPQGRTRWTLQLLSDRLVEMGIVDSISQECVRQVLKKHHQTLAEGDVVHTPTRKRRVCMSDGVGA